MKLLLLVFSLLLCLVSGADASCSFSDVTATRLSATDLSIQFRYFYRPGGISNISVYSNEFFVAILDSISIGPEIASADKVQYDYLYSGASGPRCFRAQPDGLGLGCPMSEDCANSSYNSTTRPNVASFTADQISSQDSDQVFLQWVISDTHTNISTYCTLEDSPLIVFKEVQPSSQSSTVVRLQEGTSYTCYISGWNEFNIGPSFNTIFTTRPAPPYALVVNNIESDSVNLSWNYRNVSDRTFTVFVDKDCIGNGYPETTGSGTNLIINGLSPFTFYCLRVTATISSANVTSLPVSTGVRTSEAVPGVVRNLVATPTSTTTVLLSWNEPLPRNGVITSYHVSVDGTSFRDIGGNTTMIYVGDLDACRSTNYNFSVSARTSAGREGEAIVTAATLTPRPEIPEMVEVNRQNNSITWTTVTPTDCIRGTLIRFQPVQSLEDPVSINTTYTGSALPTTITLPLILKQGVAYNVSLRSYGPGGTSDPTQPILSSPVMDSSFPYDRTNFLQLQFTGVGTCDELNKTVSLRKVADALLERMSSICPDYNGPNIDLNSLNCIGENQVLFRFQILSQTDVEFLSCLEYWYTSDSSYLLVADQLLLIDKSCNQLYISSLRDPACMITTTSCSISGPVAGGFIGGIIIGALLAAIVIVITLLTCFRRKLVQRNTQKTGIGSCTVLDTVGTNYKKKAKKAKPIAHHQQASRTSSEEDNYEMLPYQGDGTVASEYVENPSNKTKSTGATKEVTVDPDYEVPGIFFTDRQKAAAENVPPSPQYEPIEGDPLSPVKHLPLNNKSSSSKQTNTLPSLLSHGALPSHGAKVPFVKLAPAPTNENPPNQTTPKVFKMPALPTKQEDIQLSTTKEATKKKQPLVPKISQSGAADQKPSVISKAKMFESALTGPQPPKPKPKPKGKDVPCGGNTAYQLWKPK